MRAAYVALIVLASCGDDAGETLSTTPLRSRATPAPQRFVPLDPGATGLEFRNELEPHHVIPYIYNGAGVAVGDYDADGLPDVYLVSQDGPNKLFRQTAPLRFEDVTESAGGLDGGAAWGTMATFVDIDNDSDLDLYVCNLEAPNLLYQNRGDGTFVENGAKLGLSFTAASSTAAFADYDNDGDLDLYLLTNRVLGPTLPRELIADVRPPAATPATIDQIDERERGYAAVFGKFSYPGGQPDRLIRNDGYATWTDVTERAGITDSGMGLSATWWDCDGDGWLDLYVANDLESPDKLYRNRRDGTFEDISTEALPHTAYYGMGSDFGDIDNDGRFDFCVADMSSRTHYMAKMLMGNMGDRRWFLENAEPRQYMRNALFVNTGTERFAEAAYLSGVASTDWTWTVRFDDLDNDGFVDLFVTNGIPRFDNDPDLQPEFKRLWQLGQRERALDLARNIPPVEETNLAFRNLGDYEFAEVGAAWGLAHRGVSHGAALVDLDRDGDLDVITNDLNAPARVFENRTDDAAGLLVALRGEADNRYGVGARVDVEAGGETMSRIVMLARGYLSSSEPIAHFGLGDATRVDRLTVTWPSGGRQVFEGIEAGTLVTVRQAPGGDRDALDPERPTPWFAAAPTAGVRHTEQPFDDYATQPLLPHRHSRLGPGVAVGDRDGDGRDDAVLTGAAGSASQFLETAPVGGIAATTPIPMDGATRREHLGALWFDADGDGDQDLYLVAGSVEHGDDQDRLADRLLRNDGDGTFTDVAHMVLPSSIAPFSGSCVTTADFDRDGQLDLFVGGRVVADRYPEAPGSVLLRNDAGVFRDVTNTHAPGLRDAGLVTSARFSDYDGDGFADLLVTAHWQPIRVLQNREGKRFVDRTSALGLDAHTGLWNGIAAGDFDRDGDLDYVATNLGWNSKYHADPDHPIEIYARDFDGSGTLDIIEAKHSGERHLPVRGKSCSTAAMPFLGEKFRTFDAFARASLEEIYSSDALAAARVLRATTLANSLVLNHGDRFEVRPLPRLAQIAPGFGVVASDFDNDGELDLVIAQNFHSPEPETGNMDGGLGLVLRGLGDAAFEPLIAADAGVVVPGDAKSLAILDWNGDARPDLLFGLNDGPIAGFTNAATAPHALAIRLRGTAGNPTAIGARVALGEQLREVHAGGSYLAQSTSRVFLRGHSGPGRVDVTWPDGTTSSHELESATGTVTIER